MKLVEKSAVLTETIIYSIEGAASGKTNSSSVNIEFKNGIFTRASEYFSDLNEREKWELKELTIKKIKKIEKRYKKG